MTLDKLYLFLSCITYHTTAAPTPAKTTGEPPTTHYPVTAAVESTKEAIMSCKPNPCKNGGVCNGEDGSCYCIGGFTGKLCEIAPTSDPAETAAEQTAKSESTTETADASMVCKPNPCKNGGICNGEDGSCYCIGGFIGRLSRKSLQ